MNPEDMELVREFAGHQSEPAFAALVERHVTLVYSAALRQTQDATLAEEVTQTVFVILARKAATLGDTTILSAWLYRTTHNVAANALTSQHRRQKREQEAYMLSTLNDQPTSPQDDETASVWQQLAPRLEDVLAGLNERDRVPLVLHYFEGRPWREVARLMRITEDAAQKRASRALEKLRAGFAKQGIALTAVAIASAITANSMQAVPIGLAAKISAAALTGTVSTTLITTTKIIAMTTLQKIAVTSALVATVGVGFYEAKQAANARAEVQALKQSQLALQSDLEQMKMENQRLASKPEVVKEQNAMSAAQLNELLKLRGQVGQMNNVMQQMQKTQTALQSAAPFAFPSNLLMGAVESQAKSQIKTNAVKTAILKGVLNLNDSQAQALNEVLNRHTQSSSQLVKDMMSGKLSTADVAQAMNADKARQQDEINALLMPDQASAYQTYQQTEAANAAVQRAGQQLTEVMQVDGVELSQQQQDAVRQAFTSLNLSQPDPNQTIPLNSGDLANSQKQNLDSRLQVLAGILTPDQLQAYQQNQEGRIAFVTGMIKMLSPQKNQ